MVMLIVGVAWRVSTFPWSDVGAAYAHPSPATIVRLAVDIAGFVSDFDPRAKVVAIGSSIAVVMVSRPSRFPLREGQTAGATHGWIGRQ
jgi:hypothetical protein